MRRFAGSIGRKADTAGASYAASEEICRAERIISSVDASRSRNPSFGRKQEQDSDDELGELG
jgi:hypothetical protein